MRTILPLIWLLLSSFCAAAQTFSVTGTLITERNDPLKNAEITLKSKSHTHKGQPSDSLGHFSIPFLIGGTYHITFSHPGYELYEDSFTIADNNINLGTIHMIPAIHMLDEVKIVEKVLAVVQKDDTVEYNSGAYKVNPDADAADLVRKMPLIELNDKKVVAQGETVVKVLVDGKPFFGDDPYASLKNIPAEMIDKVQVYNEKTDQDRATGFNEGPTSKTINIVTKPGKKKGTFGKATIGGGEDNSHQAVYGTSITLNSFNHDQRLTITGQSNNINIQNFTGANAAMGGAGIINTNAAGINYNDKWGRSTDVSLSYFFNTAHSTTTRELTKRYILPIDSGQIYNESNPGVSTNYTHNVNLRYNYLIDTQNTILWQPRFSWNTNDGNTERYGHTTLGATDINRTSNRNYNDRSSYNWGGNLLYNHIFHRKGQTFSLSVNTSGNGNDGTTVQHSENIYYLSPSLSDTLDQKILQTQNSWNLTSDAAYTQPISQNGLLKLEYVFAYLPSQSEKNGFDSTGVGSYTLRDSILTNSFHNNNIAHKAGASYLYHGERFELSAGLRYQYSELTSQQYAPTVFTIDRPYSNLLPNADFRYKISKTRHLQISYTTNTQPPSVNQLQNVVNNNDPLHLYTGNPDLLQPYSHNLILRYNTSNVNARNNFSASINGRYTMHAITESSYIAQSDTVIRNILLAKGSQLTMPQNIEGSSSFTANLNYSQPLDIIKCRINVNTSTGINRVPSLINNELNYQNNKNGSIGISLNSNISEDIDFTLSSNTALIANANTINTNTNTQYVNENCRASVDLILWKSIVVNTSMSYQANYGLPAAYNQDYVLWNISIGRKLFKKHQGDIRLSVFDVLNNNNNIQHTITDTYIQDARSNILQRYFLLVFNYKLSKFGSGEAMQ